MATKRSRESAEASNEEEKKAIYAQQQLELSANSSNNKKQRSVVSAENENLTSENSRKGLTLTVAGREVRQQEEQTVKSILELGLPVMNPVEMMNLNKVGNFLEACSLCKMELHGKDVYMYGGAASVMDNTDTETP